MKLPIPMQQFLNRQAIVLGGTPLNEKNASFQRTCALAKSFVDSDPPYRGLLAEQLLQLGKRFLINRSEDDIRATIIDEMNKVVPITSKQTDAPVGVRRRDDVVQAAAIRGSSAANELDHDDKNGVNIFHASKNTPASLQMDRELASWRGKIAVGAKAGSGLDSYKAALNWAHDNVPPDTGLLEKAKQEIQETAARHLAGLHGADVLNAIYLTIFPDDAPSNNELDADIEKRDRDAETTAEIKRLAALSLIEYERQRKNAAEKLGIDRITVLDKAVEGRRAENSDTKGQGRPLDLPEIEPWPDPVNGAELLDQVVACVRQYLILPDGGAETIAFWVLHTHVFDCFTNSPRLAITSPEKGCGKTTLLDVIGELVARPLPTSNATTAAVFRVIEMKAPTLLIDEADTFLKDNDELRGVLNTGHRKGGYVTRTVGDDFEPRQFTTWAPAAIAMIGRLPDTLDDRAITVRLRRRKPNERVRAFRSDRAGDLRVLARKAARWTLDNQHTLTAADPETGTLFNRAADNWRPLLAIADLAGGEWPRLARSIAECAEAGKQDQSVKIMLLGDIRDIITERPHTDRIGSSELAATLGAMEGRPWPEWRNGKPITAAALARLLSPFGIISRTHRDGEHTFKGYLHRDFDEAFASYLPDQTVTPSQLNNDGHCDTLQSVTLGADVTVSKVSQPNNGGHCDVVTDEWDQR
jgi:putative DNA primase/helicase